MCKKRSPLVYAHVMPLMTLMSAIKRQWQMPGNAFKN
jgi:hypothetical protein